MSLLDAIYLHRYRLFLLPVEELRLPEFKGSALRGVFGHALRRVACVIPEEECGRCALRANCAYALLFEPTPPDSFPDAAKFKNFPRPYLINPPLSRQRAYAAGEPLMFEVVLVGKAVEFLPHVILAFEAIGRQGFSGGRGRFEVAGVAAMGTEGLSASIYAGGALCGTGAPIHFGAGPPEGDGAGVVTIHFITPARFEIDGKLQNSAPPFSHLLRTTAQRATLLAALFCGGGPPEAVLSAEDLTAAEAVRLIDADIGWQEHERYSSRQQSRMRQGGIVGSAVYYGPIGRFRPYLKLMGHLNTGKSTTFGLGRVALSFG